MEGFKISQLTFTYPDRSQPAIADINLSVARGEFLLICGASGSGKTTLIRNLKPSLSPKGQREGQIQLQGQDVFDLDPATEARRIGYVLQNPDNQIVTDKVWHELAFGAESLGWDGDKIRRRVAEMASYFNLEAFFHRNTNDLSGGQKQTLNLASIMVMDPDILILDEPTSQLDPIGASDFLETVYRINKELGTTVIMTEHRLDKVIPMADRLAVLDGGRLVTVDKPRAVGQKLLELDHKMLAAMPIPFQAYALAQADQELSKLIQGQDQDATMDISMGASMGASMDAPMDVPMDAPMDVQEGRIWLGRVADKLGLAGGDKLALPEGGREFEEGEAISLSEIWFKYGKDQEDVLKNLNLKVKKGEVLAVLGGNGSGKSTMLSIISGIKDPYRGKVKIFGRSLASLRKDGQLYSGLIGMVPQNPQTVFASETVEEELQEMVDRHVKLADKETERERVMAVAKKVGIDQLLPFHPYDLSGGEQQRLAIAKVLLLQPQIILLDEPTKGIDNFLKEELAKLIGQLAEEGKTVIMVSHDVEFCARHADRCTMLFDGDITVTGRPRSFFSGNSHYTTSGNKMSRQVFANAITAEDIYYLLRDSKGPKGGQACRPGSGLSASDGLGSGLSAGPESQVSHSSERPSSDAASAGDRQKSGQLGTGGQLLSKAHPSQQGPSLARGKSLKTFLRKLALPLVVAIAFAMGLYMTLSFDDQRSYLIASLIVVFAIMVPFFVMFEKRKASAYEVVLIAVLVTLAVVGRLLFIAIPNVKPVFAIVIIAGAFLGPSRGFVVGSMTAFVSNFMFGQGPWTPYQMLAWGIMGLVAGLIGQKMLGHKYPVAICAYGFIASFVFHGLITDIWTVLSISDQISWASILAVYGAAIPVNVMLAISTVIFLWILTNPMVRKLDRLNKKWDIVSE